MTIRQHIARPAPKQAAPKKAAPEQRQIRSWRRRGVRKAALGDAEDLRLRAHGPGDDGAAGLGPLLRRGRDHLARHNQVALQRIKLRVAHPRERATRRHPLLGRQSVLAYALHGVALTAERQHKSAPKPVARAPGTPSQPASPQYYTPPLCARSHGAGRSDRAAAPAMRRARRGAQRLQERAPETRVLRAASARQRRGQSQRRGGDTPHGASGAGKPRRPPRPPAHSKTWSGGPARRTGHQWRARSWRCAASRKSWSSS